MRANRVAVVTTVSTAMLGAGWVAGIVGMAAGGSDATVGAIGTTDSSSTPTATATDSSAATTAPTASAAATATPAAEPVVTETPAGVSGTFDGALVSTGEGDFQAEIVVQDGTITAVNVLVDGDNRHDSVRINEVALPLLQERVLAAQSWDVQGISGASYTVQGFLTSVKDAMQQAGLA